MDLFTTASRCLVCDGDDCTLHLYPDVTIPHYRDRFDRPHVLAPIDVFSEPGPTGNSVKLIAVGDPVSLEVAVAYGWAEPIDGKEAQAARAPRRRQPPAPRGSIVA